MSRDYYYRQCKECEYLYHCYAREIGEKIQDDDVDDMYLCTDSYRDHYPEM